MRRYMGSAAGLADAGTLDEIGEGTEASGTAAVGGFMRSPSSMRGGCKAGSCQNVDPARATMRREDLERAHQAPQEHYALAIAATSAAKSSFFLSMPSPTTNSANDKTLAPAVSRCFSTVILSFLTNDCP